MATAAATAAAATAAAENDTPAERKQFVTSNSNSNGTANVASWKSCYYCTRENFKSIGEFVK